MISKASYLTQSTFSSFALPRYAASEIVGAASVEKRVRDPREAAMCLGLKINA